MSVFQMLKKMILEIWSSVPIVLTGTKKALVDFSYIPYVEFEKKLLDIRSSKTEFYWTDSVLTGFLPCGSSDLRND